MREDFEIASQGRMSSRNNYAGLKVIFQKTRGRKAFRIMVPQHGTNY